MAYPALADYLEDLLQEGLLTRVDAEVDPAFEVAEITNRVAREGGAALLFGNIKGHRLPVVTNLLGSERRIARAAGGISLAKVADRVAGQLLPPDGGGWLGRLTGSPHPSDLGKYRPRSVNSGPCQQVVKLASDVDLAELPALRCGPHEPRPTLTAALVIVADPETGRQQMGRLDVEVLDAQRVAVCWTDRDEQAPWLAEYRLRELPMPVAIALGGDPAVLLAACAPLAPGADRWSLAGLLREKPVELVACRQIDLKVPADAEIVIEGTIDTAAPLVTAGPRVMPGGFYTHAEQAPAVDVAAVTHRVNPVFPAMVPGGPPCESLIVERAMWRMLMPAIKLAIPELVDLQLPLFGGVRHWAIASIRKTHAGQARRVAQAVWGLAQSRSAKLLVVVDDDVNAADTEQVLAAMAANVRPRRDVWFGDGPPDPLDPASPSGVLGQRMAIDATRKLPGEREGELPRPAVTSEEIARLVSRRWAEYGLGPEPEGR